MAPHKRKSRPNEGFRIEPRLPKPWGRVGPWQTGLFRKSQAEQVEAWLHEMALTRPELIDALTAPRPRFTLRDAWVAKLRGTLDELVAGIADPTLKEAVEAYRPECTDKRTLRGLDELLEYAATGVRLSWLRGNNIRGLYRQAKAAGLKPNSIQRSLHRAVVQVVTYHLGAAGKRAAFEGVTVPGENDTREVSVTGAELQKVLDGCGVIRGLAIAAITTAIDVGPLLRMKARHVTDEFIEVPDKKSQARPRKLKVSDVAWAVFRQAALGKELDEPLWPLKYQAVYYLWTKAAAAAGRPDLRFKDLRHVLPTLLAELGMERRSIQAYLGHAQGSKSTDRYITPTGDVAVLDAAAAKLGLSHLKVG